MFCPGRKPSDCDICVSLRHLCIFTDDALQLSQGRHPLSFRCPCARVITVAVLACAGDPHSSKRAESHPPSCAPVPLCSSLQRSLPARSRHGPDAATACVDIIANATLSLVTADCAYSQPSAVSCVPHAHGSRIKPPSCVPVCHSSPLQRNVPARMVQTRSLLALI